MFKDIEFKSVGEVVDYVLEGGVLYHSCQDRYPNRRLELYLGEVSWCGYFEKPTAMVVSSNLLLSFKIKQEWWENIPDCGVLVRRDEGVYIVNSWDKATDLLHSIHGWLDKSSVTPLTKTEIKKFLDAAVDNGARPTHELVVEDNIYCIECDFGGIGGNYCKSK